MLARRWRNYWLGAWMIVVGTGLAALGWFSVIVLGMHLRGVPIVFASWTLGAALAAAGLAVWAYRFHTEPRETL
jgi:hypothetical protein